MNGPRNETPRISNVFDSLHLFTRASASGIHMIKITETFLKRNLIEDRLNN